MAEQSREDPGHQQLGDEGIDERQQRRPAAVLACAIFSGVVPSAAIQGLPRAMYQPAPASQAATAAITIAR